MENKSLTMRTRSAAAAMAVNSIPPSGEQNKETMKVLPKKVTSMHRKNYEGIDDTEEMIDRKRNYYI
jgi:hypothetical protein